MADADTVLEEIRTIVAQDDDFRPRMDPGAIMLTTRFKEDLGFDSIALMSLAFGLQEAHPDLDETAIAGWVTVADCVTSVLGT